ncbi:MAG: DUF6089 family protein [Marinilabilia sp.]
MRLTPISHILLVLIAAALFFPGVTRSQDRIEVGALVGGSYYLGDLNPDRHFYQANPAFGTLVRVVLNPRIAFRGSLSFMEVSGKYPRKNILFPESRGNQYRFERNIAEMSTQLEINFFDYDHPFRPDETRFTPYISGGLGYMIYRRYPEDGNGDSENPQFILSLPFGLGVKWKASDWMHVGLEWSFRKTFVDDIDVMDRGVIDPSDPYGFDESTDWHNNDWYSFAGVFVTFDLFHRKMPCNAGY